MAWTNLGTGNVSTKDVKDAIDGTAPINADLAINDYIGQSNNGVHNALFDSNAQPSINTDPVRPGCGGPDRRAADERHLLQ